MKQFSFRNQTKYYQGKVRDVYTIADTWIVMIASDRISAFDVILPKTIPFKGQVLNQIAAYMLNATKDICPNWLLDVPSPVASIGWNCEPIKIEMVVRGNLTGHAWRTYRDGGRVLCGVPLPEGMKENDFFPSPIITPTTKADKGHDEDISKKEILQRGLVTEAEWKQLELYARKLFQRGKQIAAERGLILADTKYEFGKRSGVIMLMDEVHTPDSSRYFYADGFEERLEKNKKQLQLSKEFVREWLIENNFMGQKGQQVPEMTPEWIETIRNRYIELYEKIIGEKFKPEIPSETDVYDSIVASLEKQY